MLADARCAGGKVSTCPGRAAKNIQCRGAGCTRLVRAEHLDPRLIAAAGSDLPLVHPCARRARKLPLPSRTFAQHGEFLCAARAGILCLLANRANPSSTNSIGVVLARNTDIAAVVPVAPRTYIIRSPLPGVARSSGNRCTVGLISDCPSPAAVAGACISTRISSFGFGYRETGGRNFRGRVRRRLRKSHQLLVVMLAPRAVALLVMSLEPRAVERAVMVPAGDNIPHRE